MEPIYFPNGTSIRNDIRPLETFSTGQLIAEVRRRRFESDRAPNYTRIAHLDTAPENMTPEYFNKKLEDMMNLSVSAFSIRVSLNREPNASNRVRDKINKIIIDDCCSYQNRMNILLAHNKNQYAVLEDPHLIDAFLRLQESELGALEEVFSMQTVASIQAVTAGRSTPPPAALP